MNEDVVGIAAGVEENEEPEDPGDEGVVCAAAVEVCAGLDCGVVVGVGEVVGVGVAEVGGRVVEDAGGGVGGMSALETREEEEEEGND